VKMQVMRRLFPLQKVDIKKPSNINPYCGLKSLVIFLLFPWSKVIKTIIYQYDFCQVKN
jgi:hypothetical protein